MGNDVKMANDVRGGAMTIRTTARRAIALLAFASALLPAAPAAARERVERVVMVMRHGVRAPLGGEVPDGTLTAAPWPKWPVAPEQMTPHGLRSMEVRGAADRIWLAGLGVLPARGCPAAGAVNIWTNVSPRTIDSGRAFADGFAPGCDLPIGHRASGEVDPLFEALRADTTGFDPVRAIASINAYTGGMDRLVQRHAAALKDLDHILGCKQPTCSPGPAAAVKPSRDGHGIDLEGPIRRTSGIAQVLLLQYAEGMPARDVGWGRADAASIQRVGALHAALFDVFTRPPYMAAHQAGPLGRRIIASLTAPTGPSLDLLVGHDTNVTALAAALRLDLTAPGYAPGDTAPAGALVLERLYDDTTNTRSVRLSYRTQSPTTIRTSAHTVSTTNLPIPGRTKARQTRCPLDAFVKTLATRLADEWIGN